jgi:hypothetical protein
MLRFRRSRARTPGIDDLIPPERALPPYTRKGDFKKAGARFLQAAVDAGLEPHYVLLDLGCGVGRLAVASAHPERPLASGARARIAAFSKARFGA